MTVRRLLVAGALYAATTVALFFNLVPHLSTHLYSDLGDPLLNAAILTWNAHHVPLTEGWWNFPTFAPYAGVTAWTEHLLAAYPLTSPIIWATGNGILAYNVLLLSCIVLNGLCAFLLIDELMGSTPAALIGGLAFAFAPFQAVHVSHVQTLMAFGMPLTLFGLHRYARDGRWSSLAWAGVGWESTLLSNAYTMVFFGVFAGAWCLWFLREGPADRRMRIVGMLACGVLLLGPLLWGYHVRLTAYGFMRSYTEMRDQSADIAGLVGASHRSLAWGALLPVGFGEGAIYPGVTIVALAVVGLWRGAGPLSAPSRWSRRLFVAALAVLAVSAIRAAVGPDAWHLGAVDLPRLTPFRGVTLGAVLVVLAAGWTRRVRSAWTSADPVVFYALAAVMMWLLSLGPEPRFLGARALAYGPYRLLLSVPGLEGLRVPARAWLPATLALAVCAAAGVRAVAAGPWRRSVVVAVAVAILADGWFYDWAREAPAARFRGVIPVGALVLDLPMGDAFDDMDASYRAVVGAYRAVVGYSGYTSPHYLETIDAIRRHDSAIVDAYRALADLYVIVRPSVIAADRLWIDGQHGATLVWSAGEWRLVRLPRLGAHPVALPLPLPRAGAGVPPLAPGTAPLAH